LSALCDLRQEHAQAMADRYGFARAYGDLGEMLDREKPDGCVAISPLPVTAQIASRIIREGVPLLMEKPPGATVEEAREIAELVDQRGVPVMVSMNRRFDPAFERAMIWKRDRPVAYLRGTIIRHNRRETDFILGTAIHPVDTMRAIAGDVQSFSADMRRVDGVQWYVVHLTFRSGTIGTLEVLTTTGAVAESYECFGTDYRVNVRVGEADTGEVCCWEKGQLVVREEPAQRLPLFVRNGAYGETVAFIAALKSGCQPRPSPADVLGSVELCHAIARRCSQGTREQGPAHGQ
jgi:predicted dehydrogenase